LKRSRRQVGQDDEKDEKVGGIERFPRTTLLIEVLEKEINE